MFADAINSQMLVACASLGFCRMVSAKWPSSCMSQDFQLHGSEVHRFPHIQVMTLDSSLMVFYMMFLSSFVLSSPCNAVGAIVQSAHQHKQFATCAAVRSHVTWNGYVRAQKVRIHVSDHSLSDQEIVGSA